MTKARWNKLKAGDGLANERSRKRYVVVGVDFVRTGNPDGTTKRVVHNVRIARFIDITDPKQWRVLTKKELEMEIE